MYVGDDITDLDAFRAPDRDGRRGAARASGEGRGDAPTRRRRRSGRGRQRRGRDAGVRELLAMLVSRVRRRMRFADFLRTTVLISAAAATALAAVDARERCEQRRLAGRPGRRGVVGAGGVAGVWFGRRAEASQQIASLLASARTQAIAARARPGAHRPQPAMAAAALDDRRRRDRLRRAAGAGGRDRLRDHLGARLAPPGVRGDRDRGAGRRPLLRRADVALQPIKLVRTPGFRSNLFELNGAGGEHRRARRGA